jgi:hypothetical protein
MDYAFAYMTEDPEPPKPKPVAPPAVPPEVWNQAPIDPEKCAAATKALCS